MGRVGTVLCVGALVVTLCAVVLPGLFGLQRYLITGGSMTGTIAKGSIIYSRIVPADRLRVGDIITFHPPGGFQAVTHRIIGIEVQPDGTRMYSTKGDYNQTPDPWNPVKLNEPSQARYVIQIPLMGYVLAVLGTRQARIALIALPAVLIALSLLWSLWKEAGEQVVRSLDDDGLPHDARSRA